MAVQWTGNCGSADTHMHRHTTGSQTINYSTKTESSISLGHTAKEEKNKREKRGGKKGRKKRKKKKSKKRKHRSG